MTMPSTCPPQRGAARGQPRSRWTPRLLAALIGLVVASTLASLGSRTGLAHEAWLLTPERVAELNARPRPELFTRLTAANATMLAAAAAGAVGWLLLAATGAGRARRAGALARVEALDRHAPVVLRVCLALTLATAALGLHPRHGTGALQAATLGFPDLELRLLGPGWGWLTASSWRSPPPCCSAFGSAPPPAAPCS